MHCAARKIVRSTYFIKYLFEYVNIHFNDMNIYFFIVSEI